LDPVQSTVAVLFSAKEPGGKLVFSDDQDESGDFYILAVRIPIAQSGV
jgi:hypothetical protein